MRFGSDIGLPIAVSPSGTRLLSKQNLQRLKDAGTKAISLSIDGSTADTHDDFRRVPGSFDITLNGWKVARQLNLKVQINTTVTRYNFHDLPEIFRLVHQWGAMTWSLFFLVPTGRDRQEDEISASEYEGVMHFLYDVSRFISAKPTEGHHYKRVLLQRSILEKKGLNPEDYLALPPAYSVLKENLNRIVENLGLKPQNGLKRTPMHLNSANGFVFINRRGEVFPSGFLPLSAGNIRRRSVADIYRSAPLFVNLRDPDKYEGRCGVCEFVHMCGGSRSRAYAITKNPFAEDPFCNYIPQSFAFQKELAALLSSG